MLKPSVRWEIVTALTIAMVASSFLISLMVMSITKRSLVDQKVEDTATLITFFQHSVASIHYENDAVFQNGHANRQIQELVTLFAREKGMQKIFVSDRNGRILASNDLVAVGTMVADDELKNVLRNAETLTRAPEPQQGQFKQTTDELSVSAPLFVGERVVGALHMKLSLSDIQSVFATSFRLIVFYIVFTTILIIVFGSYLLSRVVVRPLKKLVNATEAIGKGDFNLALTDRGRDELGQLSLAFNRMADRISEHQKELRNKIVSLETLNQELKESQKEVLAGEKLALVGKLSAGVAHEIGNPLSAVLGYISLLKKKEGHAPDACDYLRRMEQELLRINKTIRGLLDFSRLEKVEITSVDMRKVLDKSLSLVAHQGRFRTIKLTTIFDNDLWLVQGDDNLFQQVMLNLLLNAGEAVAEDGSVAVLADRMTFHGGTVTAFSPSTELDGLDGVPHFGFAEPAITWEGPLPFLDHQPVLRVVVADNGSGIRAEHLGKIFDPFFTTKEPGKGTGLGLAICTRIIESYGGAISVRSEEGTGTAFIILLPGKGPRQ